MRRFTKISVAALCLMLAVSAWGIPWMYQPTNQHGSLGNNYDEFQNYGGSPYFHDGIDVMQATGGVHVYSSSDGYMTHGTTGTQYGGLMFGDQYVAEAPGWLYWHIPSSTWQFSLGERVNEGDFIGDIATWPVSNFHHVHFDKVVGTGGVPWSWYQPTGNPLDFLVPNAETTPPEIHLAVGTNLLAFCNNNTSTYQNANNLSGDVDIIAKLGDHIFNTQWEVIPRTISYTIRSGSIYEQHLAFQFGEALPAGNWSGWNTTVYKDDGTCNTEGNYTLRNFFFVLTNNDGDSAIETTDVAGSWSTAGWPNGQATVGVRAWDAGGNVSQDSMNVMVNSPSHQLTITMTPTSPLNLPASGGSFTFNVNIHNNEATTVTGQVWIKMTYPDGHEVQILSRNLNLPGNASIIRDVTQTIAGSEPNGTYSYDGYVGMMPYNVWNTSGFDFTKGLHTVAGSGATETRLDGWEVEPAPVATIASPQNHGLVWASPNPFNPTTEIRYQIPDARTVSLKVYDTAGRLVEILVDSWQEAGTHQASFNGSKLTSGLYLYRLESGIESATGKMLLLK